jgi:hypothetical protein
MVETLQLRRDSTGESEHGDVNKWHRWLPLALVMLQSYSSSTDRRRQGGSMAAAS